MTKIILLPSLFFMLSGVFFSKNTYAISIDPQRIEKLIQQKLPNTPIGIFIQEAKNGKVLYERRAEETFLPASSLKLISTAASLFLLDPTFQYETTFKASDQQLSVMKNGVFQGNLYLEFRGDPSFTTEDLKKLVNDLKSKGIKQIRGNVVIDDTLFKGRFTPFGWMIDDVTWGFAAPVSTVILNENKLKLLVKSNKILGGKANIALAPEETLPIKISQEVISVTETEAKENCELNLKMDNENHLNIQGCWPAKDEDVELEVAVQNPNLAAIQTLTNILKTNNIVLKGKILLGSAPQNLKALATHRSMPLSALLKFPLTDSNNLYSESLLKTMGVKKFQQGTFQAGLHAMRDILNSKFGIDTSMMRLQDGSGGSRYDAVTPAQMGRVLYVMYHHPEFGKMFQAALPNSGNTGTLKKRMETFDVAGVVRAKTGTMTGVSALAGYVTTQKNEDLIFVIMINGLTAESAVAKQFENELSNLLVQSN